DVAIDSGQNIGSTGEAPGTACRLESDEAHEVLAAEDLVEHVPYEVHVLVADLDEAGAGLGEQLASHGETVTQVREVRADAGLPVARIALARRDLPVGTERDAVGRVHVYHLDLAAEVLLLGEAVHHEQGVAEDQAVRPVALVGVEVDELVELEPVEVVEQRQL